MRFKLLLRTCCFSIFTTFIALSSAQAQSWGSDSATRVMVEQVRFEREQTRVDAVGSAEARNSVVLYPAVADRVTDIHFQPGDRVEQGDVLMRLDARRQEVAVARATIQLVDAERTVDRLEQSRAEGAIPQSDLDDAVTARDLIEVTLDEAETELEDRLIRAPFDGVVGLTDVEIGDRINEQTAITTVDNRSELLIDFRAPESALELLQSSPTLTLQPWQNRSAEVPGEIIEIDSRIDPQNRTIRARALVDNSNDLYRPGMSFRVRLEILGDEYAVIPEAALLWGANSAYVWIVKDDKATRVDVQIQQRLEGKILVSADINLGDLLIVEGIQSLREGQTVEYSDAERG